MQAACQPPTQPLAPLGLGRYHLTSTPHTKPAKMATRARKAKVSIDTLNRDAIEASSAKQVFGTVSTTLARVRVSTAILRPPVDSHR